MSRQVSTRLHLLDTLRGLTLISMMAYHASWDIYYLFGGGELAGWSRFRTDASKLWQQSICWTFILLSGFCLRLGSRPIKRGLIVFGGGVAVSLATAMFMPSSIIICGILTFIGSAMLLTALSDRLLRRLHPAIGLVASFLLFAFTREVNRGYLGFFSLKLIRLPSALYQNTFTAFLGFQPVGFFSTDYFSLFPWIFLFLCGYFLYLLLNRYGLVYRLFGRGKVPVLSFMGRHSLLIYLTHQPVIYGLCYLISLIN